MRNQFIAPLFFLCTVLYAGLAHGQNVKKENSKLVVDEKALNFILMGDWGRNGEDHQKPVAVQMGKTAAEASVDFIAAAGDNFYPLGVVSEFDPLWKYSFEDIYTAFSLQWDWYPVLGNHDYGSKPDAQVAYSKISRRWKMPSRYYSKKFSIDGDTTQQVLVAFIDTTPLLKSYYSTTSHAVHDQDSTAQKRWIEKTLADPSPNIKWKLVVGHHPMYTGSDKRREGEDTKGIRRSLESLFRKYKVDAYLAGHDHSLQHIVVDQLDHFVSGAASEVTQVGMLPQSKFAASQYGFMLFSVRRESIRVQVVDEKGSILHTTSIKK